MTVIAGTGHRPKFCPCKYNEKHPWLAQLKTTLYADLDVGWNNGGIDHVITGMAIGWDTWLAEVALEIGIPVHAYIPFKGQHKRWPSKTQAIYIDIMNKCDKIVICSDAYSNDVFLKRDRAMIDNANIVFALLNPLADEGGTYYTVKYAKEKKLKVVNYWSDYEPA